jgi:hypothetical protein
MYLSAGLLLTPLVLGLALPNPVISSENGCSRQCMTGIVTQILDSMVAHDPSSLPLAASYKATENSHPAALAMMTSWRTIESVSEPSLLAIDVTNGTAYFALDVSEGNARNETVLRGRVAVANLKITELELFINRYRGDHGFSFNATQLPANYAKLMSPPANRTNPTREELMYISSALFGEFNSTVNSSSTCQFTEIGWRVVDQGNYGNGSAEPLSCSWPPDHPTDAKARLGLVVDEELGFVVTSAIIPGKVYHYAKDVSAFIPDSLNVPQQAQEVYLNEVKGEFPLLQTFGATGEVLEVLQYYDGVLQAMQINVYLSGPNMTSAWLS